MIGEHTVIEAHEVRLATVLAQWLAMVVRWLEEILREPQPQPCLPTRRKLAAQLLELRPTLERAETANGLAQALAELALLLGSFPSLVERWEQRAEYHR